MARAKADRSRKELPSALARAHLFLYRAWSGHAAPAVSPTSVLPRLLTALFLPLLVGAVAAAREAWRLFERS